MFICLFVYLGGSVNSCDECGNTLLTHALSSKVMNRKLKKDFVNYLVDSGADPNIMNNNGNSALHIAVEYFHRNITKKTVKVLVNHGANTASVNHQGLKPHHIAYKAKLSDLGDYLLWDKNESFVRIYEPLIVRGLQDDVFYPRCEPSAPPLINNTGLDSTDKGKNDGTDGRSDNDVFYPRCEPSAPPLINNTGLDSTDKGKNDGTDGRSDNDVFYPRCEPSAPPLINNTGLDSTDKGKNDETDDNWTEYECPICYEEYNTGDRIYKCPRCPNVLCERCKGNKIMTNCPFCRQDVSNYKCRDKDMESKVRRYLNLC